jgi:hypothetical protein
LATLWTRWLKPKGSPPSTCGGFIGRCICMRTTRRRLRSRRVEGYGSSQSCPSVSAMLQQHFRG